MKLLFVGPTLHGLVAAGRLDAHPDILCRGPAAQGDVARAVRDGATVIGLVDGRYEDVAAPWHKEILYALSRGVTVLGAGSLGALRAAECAAYGMIGVGEIFDRFMSGALVDDADVAQLHGPVEMDHLPLSEAFVNVEATLDRLLALGRIDDPLHGAALAAARAIFFKDLSFAELVARLDLPADARAPLLAALTAERVDRKRLDALALVDRMAALPAARAAPPAWRFAESHQWLAFLRTLDRESAAAEA